METENSSSVPPGFRFHPTEEELVGYYLNRKINSMNIDLDVIVEVDLYRIEPWDIQDKCKYGYEGQNEWYFFSYKDKKYPTGTRTNRATSAGFWKATGRDKAVLSCNRMIGMRKTLVFYKGRAPNGQKTDWIMHEYRLQTSHQAPPQEEGWVVCRAFKKQAPNQNQRLEGWSSQAHYPMIRDHNYSYKPLSYSEIPSTSNTMDMVSPNQAMLLPHSPFNSEQDHLNPNYSYTPNSFIESPQQDSSSLLTYDGTEYMQNNSINQDQLYEDESRNFENSCVDWKNLDELLTEPTSFLQSSYDRNAQNHPSHLFSYLPDL